MPSGTSLQTQKMTGANHVLKKSKHQVNQSLIWHHTSMVESRSNRGVTLNVRGGGGGIRSTLKTSKIIFPIFFINSIFMSETLLYMYFS